MKKIEKAIKRIFDLIFSLAAMIMLLPVMVIAGFLVKKEDGGPVFYGGKRVGLQGRFFRMLKFRTMVENADSIGGPSTSDDDPRLTTVGKTLRRYKLDEMPQLINVLKGDMSIVGPRPEVPEEVNTYTEDEKHILSVRPGITDWASLEFNNEGEILKGAADPHKAYVEKIKPEKIRLALKYVNEMSFINDLKIINRTLFSLIRTRI